jgi:hypothetical protein
VGRLLSQCFPVFVVCASTLACRSKVVVAREEMNGVYRTSKDIQASLVAGVNLRRFSDLKIRLDSELRIVDDRIHSDSFARDRLSSYRRSYGKALVACDLLARVVDRKIEEAACWGESVTYSSDYEQKSFEERRAEIAAVYESLERGMRCDKKYFADNSVWSKESMRITGGRCKEDGFPGPGPPDCLMRNANDLLRQADALLYGSR